VKFELLKLQARDSISGLVHAIYSEEETRLEHGYFFMYEVAALLLTCSMIEGGSIEVVSISTQQRVEMIS
jgi:predicted hydrolase (HD superfamily)